MRTKSSSERSRRVVRLDSADEPRTSAADARPMHEREAPVEAPPAAVTRPFFVGNGPVDYVCSRCLQVLWEGARPGEFVGVVIRCPCGCKNKVPCSDRCLGRRRAGSERPRRS